MPDADFNNTNRHLSRQFKTGCNRRTSPGDSILPVRDSSRENRNSLAPCQPYAVGLRHIGRAEMIGVAPKAGVVHGVSQLGRPPQSSAPKTTPSTLAAISIMSVNDEF